MGGASPDRHLVPALTYIAKPGSDNPLMLASYLAMLGEDFTVEGSPELIEELRRLTQRFLRATGDGPAVSDPPR